MNNLEIDTLSRNKIVSDVNTNFFVEAGAGSGKTTMLVNRMVAMVESGIDIGKICAITFTKAAANEFYERFQSLLIERSNPDYVWEDTGHAGQLPKPTPETRSRCEDALNNIDLCFMGTIDSFCNMVLSEHPSAAKIPSDSTLITDVDASLMYSQYYVRICEGEYGEELSAMARTFNLLHRDGKKVFSECMPFFMDNRNVHFNFPKETDFDIDRIFAEVRKGLIDLMKFLCEHKELMYDGNKSSIEVWDEIEKYNGILRRRWSTNYSNILYAIKKLPNICIINESINHYPQIVGEWFEQKKKYLKFTSDFTETSDKLNRLKYSISMTLFDECKKVFEHELRKKGYLTFFDYLFYLRNMLKEDAEHNNGKLIEYINKKHSYYLIDEFQDTNPMQAEVFFFLASEKPDSHWEKCLPRPGSLFIVGDPKQSIYRFRGADVRSFLYVKELFIDHVGEVLNLCRNFRSTRTLCEYYNKVFNKLLPTETPDQSKYEDIPLPDKTNNEFQGVFTYNVYEGRTAEEEHPFKNDENLIHDIIRRLVNQEQYLIRAKGDKEPRPIRYSDFMIITYGKPKLAPIMDSLKVHEIPFKVEGKIPFETNEALIETMKLYSVVTDTEDMLSLYGSLTGKIYHLLDKDILDYKDCGGSLSLTREFDRSSCENEYAIMVADAIDELKTWNKKSKSMSPAALFSGIVEGFKIFNYVSADNIEVLYYTIELIRNAEKAGIIVNHKDCVKYVSILLSGTSDQERCLALSDNIDCVRMANLHKVKGLEAPIIILAGASNRQRPNYQRIEHNPDSTEGYVFKRLPEDGDYNAAPYFETSDYEQWEEAEKVSGEAETQRLIYVAATRARNALIIAQRYQASSNGKTETLASKWSPIVEEATKDIFEFLGKPSYNISYSAKKGDPDELYMKGEDECVIKHTEEEETRANEISTYKIVNPSALRVKSKASDTSDDDTVDPIDRRYPRLLGTTVHRLMEIIVCSKMAIDMDAAVSEVIREFKYRTDEKLLNKLTSALKCVAATMANGGYEQTNGVPKDLLSTLFAADEVYCEVPFSYKDIRDGKETINKGIIDVIYCSEGNWHIVDYKTNAESDDLDIKYQNQLAAYVKAFKETTGKDADARTYHFDVG